MKTTRIDLTKLLPVCRSETWFPLRWADTRGLSVILRGYFISLLLIGGNVLMSLYFNA